ncbi:MAG: phosphoribosylglycinamide formyltransferase [Eggerthellaceae bacterium]
MEKLKIGVLLSGSGTNLQAIIDAAARDGLPVDVVKVVSSRPDAFGIERARAAGIPVVALNRDAYADPEAADARIVEELRAAGAEYVVMAGYMRKVTPVMLRAFPDRVLNLHPALLPSFKGAHAIQDAYDMGVKVTGVTVHFANEDYDKGPIVAQRAVEVREGDTLDDLEARIHEAEHELYPEVLRLVAEGRVSVGEDRKVRVG